MRETAYRVAVRSGATRVSAWLLRRQATILTYHGLIAREPARELRPLHKIFVTVDAFRAQMQLLRARYLVVPLEDLVRALLDGDGGEHRVAVTFDDGWKSTHTLAAPVLRELGIPATVFLATGLIGSGARGLWTQRLWAALHATAHARLAFAGLDLPAGAPAERAVAIRRIAGELKRLPAADRDDAMNELLERYGSGPALGEEMAFMDWRDVRSLESARIDWGAHTVDHEILSRLPLQEATRQVIESRRAIERETGADCTLFAYPNGGTDDFRDEHVALMERAGFLAAVTQIPGRNAARDLDRFRLRRIDVGLEHSLPAFVAALDGLRHGLRAVN